MDLDACWKLTENQPRKFHLPSTMSELTKKPLSAYTKPWSFHHTLVSIAPTPKATTAPKGMVRSHMPPRTDLVTGTELEPIQDLLNMNTTHRGVDAVPVGSPSSA